MFRATYVGHNGWLFQAGASSLLVDPLLRERFADTAAVELRVFPPRTFDFRSFPRLDAVLLTHEHEDHFDLPSLDRIPRDVPIHVSSRSSRAMRAILGEMGFQVRPLVPGVPAAVGELDVLPMTADQVRNGIMEEWDVIPFLVRDRAGHGSFFTSIDMAPDERMWRTARTFVERPGLWSYTNNNTVWPFLNSWEERDPRTLARVVQWILGCHDPMAREWARPAALVVTGESFSFGGAQSWLNHNVFPWGPEEAARALAPLLPGERVLAPLPGQTMAMKGGEFDFMEPSPFLRSLPREEWPDREYRADVARIREFTPASGATDLPREGLQELGSRLDGLAAHLYGGRAFRALYSLSAEDLKGRKPTFALALRTGGSPRIFEYAPQACAFVPVECGDLEGTYLAIYECWATDLLAILRCELSTTALCFGRCRMWSANPERFAFDFNHPLMEYVHPLRHPEAYLARYRRIRASVAPPPPPA